MVSRPAVRLVLASTSPRRLELLARLGLHPHAVVAPELDETPRAGELPRAYALRLAEEKARAVHDRLDVREGAVVLAGDTTIALGRRILPPATDHDIQRALLAKLSGRRHHCLSAICVVGADGRARTRISDTVVAFKRLEPREIDAYLACAEGLGKAGGYAIQGRAEAFVRHLSGSHSGVVGLPLYDTRALLETVGVVAA